MNSSTAIESTPCPPNTPSACSSSPEELTRTVPDAPAPLRGLRMSGKPTRSANSCAPAAESTAAEAAVGTPADRSASFIDGLSRHSQAVRTDVPGIVQASRTCAAAMVCASIVASSLSTQSLSCTQRTARVMASTSVTDGTRS